eukprot:5637687-Pleurochrysis_carterae.AAC.1
MALESERSRGGVDPVDFGEFASKEEAQGGGVPRVSAGLGVHRLSHGFESLALGEVGQGFRGAQLQLRKDRVAATAESEVECLELLLGRAKVDVITQEELEVEELARAQCQLQGGLTDAWGVAGHWLRIAVPGAGRAVCLGAALGQER